MNNKILLVASAAMILAGCASAPASKTEMSAAPAKAAAPMEKSTAEVAEAAAESEVLARTETTKDSKDRVICRQITPTGSHRKKTICRTVGEIKADRDSAQDAVRGVTGVSAPSTN